VNNLQLKEFLANRKIPTQFQWPVWRDGDLRHDQVEVVGTLQAANDDSVYIAVGTLVIKIPCEAILGISESRIGAIGVVRLVV
jgi:hypothetical protein